MHTPNAGSSADVAVFGGGPAGLAAALALRQRGLRVALYDARHPPIDKACGEGLMPEAVRLLAGLGVTLRGDPAAFDGISFHNAQSHAHAHFPKERGLGVRRTALQQAMVDACEAAGVHMRWGASVRQAERGAFTSAGQPISADFFVVADGLCSTLAAACGFRERVCRSRRYASRQHFACAPWSSMVEVHWGNREQLYITPISKDEVGVALITSGRGRRLADALPSFPAVALRLAGAQPASAERGAVTRTRRLRSVVRGNVALVGDASGSVDAITGEGLLASLRQAHALADALAAGKPQRYVAVHRALSLQPERMARLLLLLDRYPWLEGRTLALFAARPDIFAAMLRVHLGEHTIPRFLLQQGHALLAQSLFNRRVASSLPLQGAAPQHERGL